MAATWFTAAVGAAFELARFERADRLGPILYIAMGWSGAVLVPAIWQRGGALPVGCFVAGGVVYTICAIGFTRRWPRLHPSRFSYHEVWHALDIAAAGLHFAAVSALTT